MKKKDRKLTAEEKARMEGPIDLACRACLEDAGEDFLPRGGWQRKRVLVEIACDANRPEMHGMSREDYKILSEAYHHPDTQKWLRDLLNY